MASKKYDELRRLSSSKRTKGEGGTFKNSTAANRERAGAGVEQKPAAELKPIKKYPKTVPKNVIKNHIGSRGTSGKHGRRQKPLIELLMSPAVIFALVVLVAVLGIYSLTRKNASAVFVNEEVVGQVRVKAKDITVETLTKTLTEQIKGKEGTEIQITDKIEVKPVHAKNKLVLSQDKLITKMAEEKIHYNIRAAEITVNGRSIGIVKNPEEANEIFNAVMNQYGEIDEATTKRSFVEDVKATGTYVGKSSIQSPDKVREQLLRFTEEESEYTVKPNDSPSSIAAKNNMSLEQLLARNPNVNVSKPINIGDKITVVNVKPFISVKSVETRTEEKKIPRNVVERKDGSLSGNQTKIIDEGQDGIEEITTQIVRINGVIVETVPGLSVVKQSAKDKIVATG